MLMFALYFYLWLFLLKIDGVWCLFIYIIYIGVQYQFYWHATIPKGKLMYLGINCEFDILWIGNYAIKLLLWRKTIIVIGQAIQLQ